MNFCTIIEILENQPGAYFQLHEEYAEPGYDNPKSQLIATGDWNSRTVRRRQWGDRPLPDFLTVKDPDATYETIDNTMPRIGAILEKLGAELEWEDEWCACSECNKLVRISPDSYSWKPSYWNSGGCGLYCHECVKDDPEDYLEHLEGNAGDANTLDLDLEEHEYRKVDADYENGLNGGQCDDPGVIAKSLWSLGIERFIFEIDGIGQFDVHFSVWVHESEYDKLDPSEFRSRGDDPAAAM